MKSPKFSFNKQATEDNIKLEEENEKLTKENAILREHKDAIDKRIDELENEKERLEREREKLMKEVRSALRVTKVYRKPQKQRPLKRRVLDDGTPYRVGAPLTCQEGQGVEFKELNVEITKEKLEDKDELQRITQAIMNRVMK